eukprot:scaffold28117_cov64-Phaeocystis_antarctica.AAC.18
MPDGPRVRAGRTFSVAWACRDVFREFNDCLKLQCAHSPRPPARPASACATVVRSLPQDNGCGVRETLSRVPGERCGNAYPHERTLGTRWF